MTVTMVASFVAAAFILIILLGLYTKVDKTVNLSIRYFRLCAWLCFAGLILDGFFYVVTTTSLGFLSSLISYLSSVMTDGLIVAFAFYFQSVIEGNRKRPGKLIMTTIIIASIDFLFLTIGIVSDKLFYYENGTIVAGPWYSYVTVFSSTAVTLLFIYIMVNRKALGRTYTLAMSSFFIFSFSSGILFLIYPFFYLSYVATALAVVMGYVFIQSRIIAEANVRAETYNSLSVRDFLTGLKNRRGFHETVQNLIPETEVGVIFSDINGLKMMNDNYGHRDGDLLIQRMASLLTENFPDAEIFRISGDEFVLFLELGDDVNFEERAEMFRKTLVENDQIAVCGYSKGRASEIIELIRQAESIMYEEKKLYYERTGKERRY